MRLIRSNRTESLADALASAVQKDPLSPVAAETIVVQSRGMERWLTLALAERLGVWSNPRFPFPRLVIEQVLERLEAGATAEASGYEPEQLKWTIAQLLSESAPPELRGYLGQPTDADRALRFAGSLAAVFDRYVVHRPQMLRAWADGDGSEWQAALWRRVVERLGPHDLSIRIDKALDSLRSASMTEPGGLQRLHLFALETLPPLFMRFFGKLSQAVPTTLYVLEPSVGPDPAAQLSLSLEVEREGTHPLLFSMGRLSGDFRRLLTESDALVQETVDAFAAPDRATLLSALQSDILELREPPAPDDRTVLRPADDSISVHACSGPMREAQVLHDLIRAALEADPCLQPHDVVVMAPDLETYAPVFRAVFNQNERHPIPCEVHDRRTREDVSVNDDFLAVLEALESRFSVLDLVRLMDANTMREEFRFSPEERSRLTELLEDAGARWGIDAEHRTELGFPAEELHTWRAGLARLFLGFASMPDAMDVFEGLVPRGKPTLADAELVARLSRLCEILFEAQGRAHRPLSVGAWVLELERLAKLLFDEDGAGAAVTLLRGSLRALEKRAEQAGYGGLITSRALRRELGALLLQKAPPIGFLRRGVTLTELVPLRSIPFRLICLAGMSEDAFPRSDDRPAFDLTRGAHSPGDRTTRHDDRHSFLQVLLCARDRLIVTYSASFGGPRRGASPSSVVWELQETVNRYYRARDGRLLLEPTFHPLHAFDSRYFRDSDLPQSFSERSLELARVLQEPALVRPRLELRAKLDAEADGISTQELASWLWNPTKAFFDRVVRARFETTSLYEPSGALTKLSALDAAIVGGGALGAGLTGSALHAYLDAAPEFPDGSSGKLERRGLFREIEAFHSARRQLHLGSQMPSLRLTWKHGDLALTGSLDGLGAEARVIQRFTRVQGRGELSAWIEHLMMQAVGGPSLPSRTRVVFRGPKARPAIVSFDHVEDPRGLLEGVLDLYRACRQSPLPLFGRSSLVFAESMARKDRASALSDARTELDRIRKWDPVVHYHLGPDDPFGDRQWTERFEQAALAVYQPLFDHRREQ